MTKRCLFLFALLLVSSSLSAQVRPHMVAIRIAPTAEAKLTQAFTTVRPQSDPHFAHSDLASVAITGDSLIANLLSLPTMLHGMSLKPIYPTHAVVYPDIRRRSNPLLFNGAVTTSASDTELRDAEDKIARWFVLTYADSISPEFVVRLAAHSPLIELAEPRFIRKPLFIPKDTLYAQQFNLPLIKLPQAWDIVRCDSTMLLAVDDVGTDWTHEDLHPNIAINWGEVGVDENGIDKRANGIDDDGNSYTDDWHGWDFAGEFGDAPDNDTRSPDDHGTHTAGIMDARANNGKGIAGVAFGARLLPLKTAGDNSGSLDFAFQGLIYAADMHAKAVNCSFGGDSFAQSEQDAINYAFAKDCAVVAASGNSGQFKDVFPGAYQNVLDVGSATMNGVFATYAEYNTHVAIYAPGGEPGKGILSTMPNSTYGTEYGTSMAAPHACGVVGLVRQRFPWMTAQQACQQVRATSAPQPTDTVRLGYIGHGLLDALAAVTDTNAHSVRIEQVTTLDDDQLGHFVSGESGGVILRVRNYLKPVQQLWATLEVTEGKDAITLDESSVSFGAAATDQTVQNLATTLRLKVANDIDPNTRVTIRVTFYDSLVGYGPDIDYFSFVVQPSYLDLDRNNLKVTFTSDGAVGYNDPISDKQGSGFQWQHPPANIGPLARSVLFNGGLMIGSDAQHVVSAVLSSSTSADRDFAASTSIKQVVPDHGAVQGLLAVYSDSLTDRAIHVGVSVTQRCYAFTQGLAANAVVVQYILHATGSTATDSIAAAVFNDWDIGISGAVNVTRFDSTHQTAVSYRLDPNYPYVGAALISQAPPGSELNYHAIRNDGSQGNVNVYAGFDRQQKWHAMTEFFPYAGPGDISMAIGLKTLPLRSMGTVEMTLVYALAESPDILDATIEEVKALWGARARVREFIAEDVQIYPNPFHDRLHVSLQREAEYTLSVYDALGRTVLSKTFSGSSLDLSPLRLPHGIYNVEITSDKERISRTLVSQ